MKKILLLSLCILKLDVVSFSQEFVGAILIPTNEKVLIFARPEKDSIGYLINNIETDALPIINVKKIKRKYAYIIAMNSLLDTTLITGWIPLKYLGINPSNYQQIYLRETPSFKSPIINIIDKPQWGDLYHFIKKRGQWVYIKTMLKSGYQVEGWLSPVDQAANPYTTTCYISKNKVYRL